MYLAGGVLVGADPDGLGTKFSTGFCRCRSGWVRYQIFDGVLVRAIRMGWVPNFRQGFGRCRSGWVRYQLFDRVLVDADPDGLGTKFSTS